MAASRVEATAHVCARHKCEKVRGHARERARTDTHVCGARSSPRLSVSLEGLSLALRFGAHRSAEFTST